MQKVPDWLATNRDVLSNEIVLVNTAKGLYLREKCLLSEAVFRALGQDRANQPYVVLSGPSFAIEIIKHHPTAGMYLVPGYEKKMKLSTHASLSVPIHLGIHIRTDVCMYTHSKYFVWSFVYP